MSSIADISTSYAGTPAQTTLESFVLRYSTHHSPAPAPAPCRTICSFETEDTPLPFNPHAGVHPRTFCLTRIWPAPVSWCPGLIRSPRWNVDSHPRKDAVVLHSSWKLIRSSHAPPTAAGAGGPACFRDDPPIQTLLTKDGCGSVCMLLTGRWDVAVSNGERHFSVTGSGPGLLHMGAPTWSCQVQ